MLQDVRRLFSESQRRAFDKGFVEARTEDIVTILQARGVAITDDQRKRILACGDISILDRWLDRAVTASSTDELFAD
jgi:hypothetical protein